MRPPSQAVRDAIDEAHDHARRRSLPWRRREALAGFLRALELIASSGEWIAIPRVISLALDTRLEFAIASASTIAHLKRLVPVHRLPILDRAFRELSPWLHGELMPWHELTGKDLGRLALLDSGAALVQLATCHPNGYVREAAIRHTNLHADGTELPFLLLRLNDWVEPVRQAAAAAVRVRLQAACAADVVAALPLVAATGGWGRIDAPELLARIDDLLRSPEAAPALRAGLGSQSPRQRRACFRRAASSPAIPNDDLLAAALEDDDPTIRFWAGHRLLQHPAEGFDRHASMLLRDPAGSIRARSLDLALRRRLPIDLDRFLCDPHPEARSLAQTHLLAADRDIVARYHQLLTTQRGTRLAAAIAGLAESSDQTEIDRIRPFLTHETPRARRGALRALATLHASDLGALCLRALHDSHPSVTRAACHLLANRAAQVTTAALWGAFEQSGTEHGRKNALRAITTRDRWQQLPCLLRATSDRAVPIRDFALQALRRWLARIHRCFTEPSRTERAAISAALAAADIPADIRAELDFALRLRG